MWSNFRLSSIWALERGVNEGFINHRLPLEGTFISLNFDKELDLILASARPNQQCSTARHMVYQLTPSDNPARCQHLHTFHGKFWISVLCLECIFASFDRLFLLSEKCANSEGVYFIWILDMFKPLNFWELRIESQRRKKGHLSWNWWGVLFKVE